jgi:hypothetical protein
MVGRALVHGMFVALVVVLAIARPDLQDRPDPPWLPEVCAASDLCDHRTPGPVPGP